MHTAALLGFIRNLEQTYWNLPSVPRGGLRVLDMGGQDVNGTVHEKLWDIVHVRQLDVLDIEAGAGVTIVGDARRVDWWVERGSQPYDLVISTEMLEHLQGVGAAIRSAAEVLRPGGWFVGTCASTGRAPHGATGAPQPAPGEHYENVDPNLVIDHLRIQGFDPIEVQYSYDTSEPHGAGDLYWRARKAS